MIDLKNVLNEKQYEAASTTQGPVLIIAGAGSGKTRMLTYRIAAMLINENIHPENILALTFTNKAAKEMTIRIKQMSNCDTKKLTVSTFHSFGVQILRKNYKELGYHKNFTIYDQADQIRAIKDAAQELKISEEKLNFFEISSIFSEIKTNQKKSGTQYSDYTNLYNAYNHILKAYNAFDFDDLISLPIKLFKNQPEILEKYQNQYQYIMVDEFQDTSLIQYQLIAMLGKKHRNLCVVGDDDQSIYSWRGANYKNILLFEKDFSELKEIKLEQNYRSSGNILNAANSVIANNTNRKEKQLWTPSENGMSIETLLPQDEVKEAEMISELIHSIKLERHVPYKEFGILVRTNSLIGVMEETLLGEELPYKVSGGSSFFQRKEIKDLISYLRIIVNQNDEVNLLRVINTPRRGIGVKTILTLREISKKQRCSFYSAIQIGATAIDSPLSDRAKNSLQDFLDLIYKYKEKFSTNHDIATHTHDLISDINYWGYLMAEYPNSENLAKFKYANLQRFTEMMKRWETNPENTARGLSRYLIRISLNNDDGEKENSDPEGKINLMTIHASKGLEFDTVFLAGVEDHIIPHKKSIEEDEKNIEEERRLFYVAITRAKRKLYISSCQTRRRYNSIENSAPSRFLVEIPETLLSALDESSQEMSADAAEDFFEKMNKMFN